MSILQHNVIWAQSEATEHKQLGTNTPIYYQLCWTELSHFFSHSPEAAEGEALHVKG